MQAPFPCLADPTREGYRTYGLKRGSAWEVIGPAAIVRGLQARRKGHRIEKIEGDAFQMPGTFVIDRGGAVRYARYARHSGDHPDPKDLVQALQDL
jgi:peroxiredoxin